MLKHDNNMKFSSYILFKHLMLTGQEYGMLAISIFGDSVFQLPGYGFQRDNTDMLYPFDVVNSHGSDVNSHGRDVNSHGRDVNSHGRHVNSHGRDVNSHGRDVNSHGRDVNGHGRDVNTP